MLNKVLALTFILFSTVSAQDDEKEPSQTCLECKRKDAMSSFMYTFSYCEDTDECLADEWNYYNKWCTTGWQQGWKLNILD